MITLQALQRSAATPFKSDPKTNTPANLFQKRLAEAVGKAQTKSPSRTNSTPLAVPRRTIAATLRQGTDVARQNLVAGSAKTTASSPADAAVTNSTTTNTTTGTGSPLATTTAQDAPATTPSSPSEVVAALLQQNAPPVYAPGQQPSTEPGVYMTGDYIKASNLNFFQQRANHENQDRFAEYKNGLQNWVMQGAQGAPPDPPKYQTVDLAGFNQWWDQYTATIGYGPPPINFLSNTVQDNGYAGAKIWIGANS